MKKNKEVIFLLHTIVVGIAFVMTLLLSQRIHRVGWFLLALCFLLQGFDQVRLGKAQGEHLHYILAGVYFLMMVLFGTFIT